MSNEKYDIAEIAELRKIKNKVDDWYKEWCATVEGEQIEIPAGYSAIDILIYLFGCTTEQLIKALTCKHDRLDAAKDGVVSAAKVLTIDDKCWNCDYAKEHCIGSCDYGKIKQALDRLEQVRE